MKINHIALIFLVVSGIPSARADWTNSAKIAGVNLAEKSMPMHPGVNWAVDSKASVVVLRQDAIGMYSWMENPGTAWMDAQNLLENAIKAYRNAGFKVVVYLDVLKMVTQGADLDGNGSVDDGFNSPGGDHPDWLQTDVEGNPMLFYGRSSNYIRPEDEVAWISPHHPEWRQKFFKVVQSVAGLVPDGICFGSMHYSDDVSGWKNKWVSFDNASRGAYAGTPPNSSQLEEFSNPVLTDWIEFRQVTLTNLAESLDSVVKTENVNIKTILYTRGGLSNQTLAYGIDHLTINKTMDVMAHEFNPAGDAVNMGTYEWLFYYSGVQLLNELDGNRPTWFVSWIDSKSEPVMNANVHADLTTTLMESITQAGGNVWATGAGSPFGFATHQNRRAVFFDWLQIKNDWFFTDKVPVQSVGVYFSPASLLHRSGNQYQAHLASVYGTLMMLHELSIPTFMVTPLNYHTFDRTEISMLILPQVECASADEVNTLSSFSENDDWPVYYLGTDNNNCDEYGAPGAFSWSNSGIYQLEGAQKKKSESYLHSTVLDASGVSLNVYYPSQAGEDWKFEFESELRNHVFIAHDPFELPGSSVVRSRKSGDNWFYYLMNFGGLDSGQKPRSFSQEVNLSRYGDSSGAFGLEVSGNSVDVTLKYSTTNSLLTMTVDEAFTGHSVVLMASTGGAPADGDSLELTKIDPPVVSIKKVFMGDIKEGQPLPGTGSKLVLSRHILNRKIPVYIEYTDETGLQNNIKINFFDMSGIHKNEILLKKNQNVFSSQWIPVEKNQNTFMAGRYAYQLSGDHGVLEKGVLLIQ